MKTRISLMGVALLTLMLAGARAQNSLDVYGYFSTRLEKSFGVPSVSGNAIVKTNDVAEWSTPSFNLMVSHQITDKAKVFVNLNGAKASTIDVRNYWGEYSVASYFNLRLGKIYRKFGLYNEILDAVPTYYGIEPPELFDGDHLIVSRTTTFMVYGSQTLAGGQFSYSFSTDNGESGAATDATPIGYDANYRFGGGDFTVGISGYTSGGESAPDMKLGSGSPKSGVLPWMAADKFSVFGGYGEARVGNLTLQSEYWSAPHTIRRDPAKVVTVINSAGVNAAQRARFLKNPAGAVNPANVRVDDTYEVQTYYVRAGYSVETSVGEFGPYAQWDWYKNVETISSKTYGGDEEAGESEDGQFSKLTLGIVLRPIPQVAAKLDYSNHMYKLNATDVNYHELRFDVSYVFGH